ncbi:MAG: AAA domain-containing protein [Chitinophagales bacterium]|nr:AAA domain-containing protein [Chitinophagales bacterium]
MSNHKAYFEKLLKLLREEEEADKQQYQRSKIVNSTTKREEKGEVWNEVKVRKIRMGVAGEQIIEIKRISNPGLPHTFITGNSVELYSHQNQNNALRESLSGRVKGVWREKLPSKHKDMWDDYMLISVDEDDYSDDLYWLNYGNIGVEKVFRAGVFKKMSDCLRGLRDKPDANSKRLFSTLIDLQKPLLNREETEHLLAPVNSADSTLNEMQQKALRKIEITNDVFLVHGPPGTGKTTTLIEAICQVLKNENQVLVTAPSNAAVDLLTQKLVEKGISVLRIGNPLKIKGIAAEHTLEAHLNRHPEASLWKEIRKEYEIFRELQRKLRVAQRRTKDKSYGKRVSQLKSFNKYNRKDYKKLEKYLIKEIIKGVQVVSTTLVGAQNKILNSKFTTVFIDEAAQALEPAVWIPIRKAKRVIMAGDHFQLPPVVKAKIENASHDLELTLFEKVMNVKDASIMLNIQYRMHEDIMQLPNECFYQDLEAYEEVRDHRLFNEKSNEPAVLFYDTSFSEQRNEMHFPNSSSYYNPHEASLIIKHLKHLLQRKIREEIDFSIGVISPYKGQIIYLQKLIKEVRKEFGCKIDVDSIDSFQGQERDVIYISLVRSNANKRIGFLKEYRRMNVAMTRARKKLYIFGDSSTILKDLSSTKEEVESNNGNIKFFDNLIALCKKSGGYRLL